LLPFLQSSILFSPFYDYHASLAWKHLEVTIRGPIKEAPGESDNGMVMDFGDLSQLVKNSVTEHLDHQDLNVVTELHTTAENLAHWIWSELTTQGLSEALLYRIRLWETESSFVEITQQERN
jgi:6-pyruvoyltetrahydropterin/6-carboxytetrahydropterin synthase